MAAAASEAERRACEAYAGGLRRAVDPMPPGPARQLQTILGRAADLAAGDVLPPTWHWAYFAAEVAQADIGADGHERLGLFLPPVPYPRRMWAAGDIACHGPLRLGVPAERESRIASVDFKTGRSGEMAFVTVIHDIRQRGALCLREEQTVVYRARGPAEAALREPGDAVPEGFFCHPDTALQRYSGVTMNGHRIHWDRDFCREVEGYPDLVVHGPLLATELFGALSGAGPTPRRFAFRATAPVFVTTPVRIETAETADGGREGRILRADGVVAMTGSVTDAL